MDFVKCSADFTFGSTINPKPVRSKFLTKVLGFFENSRESLTVIPGKFFRVNLGQHSWEFSRPITQRNNFVFVSNRLQSRFTGWHEMTWGPFLEAPGNYRARSAVLFSIFEGSFKSFENYPVELLANETKWTSLEVRTHPTFLETLI